LQADEDIMMEELEDVWNAAPKFPDVAGEETRIDVDSFVQIYRDVDDLFEEEMEVVADSMQPKSTSGSVPDAMEESDEDVDPDDETVEAELEIVYSTLCDDAKLISKGSLKAWDEVQKLLSDGLLGDDEFEDIWTKTPKSPGSADLMLDVDGFLSFNVALDALFEFEDDADVDDTTSYTDAAPRRMVQGEDLPPGVLFAELADEDYLVGMDDLEYWIELQDMLKEGDLLMSELQAVFDKIKKTESGKLDEEGFTKLYEEIDSLFEDADEVKMGSSPDLAASAASQRVKDDLLGFLDIIIEEDKLPCGLEASEKDQSQILNIVQALERQPSNMISLKKGNIELNDLAGTWELLYSSSSAMKFNKGLSGLGGSMPNGKFGGVKQILKASKFLTDVEYKERIEAIPASASFDVTVTGNWDIRTSVSLFTGQPSIILEIEPDRVTYGPTSTRADHWKSLGPLNMLDLTYLDDDLRVMRGCTSADTIFIFKKVG